MDCSRWFSVEYLAYVTALVVIILFFVVIAQQTGDRRPPIVAIDLRVVQDHAVAAVGVLDHPSIAIKASRRAEVAPVLVLDDEAAVIAGADRDLLVRHRG